MPTDFTAFLMRDGMPRRIPDKGLSWGLQGQLKKPLTSNEAKPEDVIKEEKRRRASTILTEEEKVAPKAEIKVRTRKKSPRKAAASD
jgi:hypothetical protein